jgi:cell division protein FtsZ
MRTAEIGIAELKKHVDTLLVIPNQNLFRVATDKTTFAEAFVLADQVLYSGVACIVDLIVKEGLINLDLADVKTVLGGMGTAMMGTGEASGEQRAIVAAEEAIVNPLLDDVTLKGAKSLLLSITGGRNLTLWEVDEAANRVRQEVDPDANIIVGATFDDGLGEKVRVSIVASGMARSQHMLGVEHDALAQGGSGFGSRPDDFHSRLRDAIDDMGGDAGADPALEQGRRTPGDVVIQDGPPHLPPLASTTRGKNRANAGELPGLGRPLPGVEDFPPHAQREYWSKTGEGEQRRRPPEPPFVYQRQPAPPAPKTSLLRRLAGVGLGSRESRRVDDQVPKQSKTKGSSNDSTEQVDLPVFFGRNKR